MRRSRVHFGLQFNEPRPMGDDDAIRAAVRAMMDTGAQFAKALWLQRAQDLGIRRTGEYMRGIQDAEIRKVSETVSDNLLVVVFDIVNTSPHAAVVEDGHPAFSLPQAIDWSRTDGSIKRGPNGPYLHIAFRHAANQSADQREASGMTVGTLKTMMPADIYRQAKVLRAQVAQRAGPLYRGEGEQRQFVAADRYTKPPNRGRLSIDNNANIIGGAGGNYESRRSERMVAGRTDKGKKLTNPEWQTPKYEGLFKSGGSGHTSYMTVRTLTPRSAGWNTPAQPGHGIARQVAGALSNGPGADRFRELLTSAAVAAIQGAT